MKKYEFTERKQEIKYEDKVYIVTQIRALIDIPQHNVKAGSLGGWLEEERNLSHLGDCWVEKCAGVYMGARIQGDVLVRSDESYSNSLYESEFISSHIRDNANINASGFANECVIDDGTFAGKLELNGTSLYKTSLTGHVLVNGGFLERTSVIQTGNVAIDITHCVIVQPSGSLIIQNEDNKRLELFDLTIDFENEEYTRRIEGYGTVSNLCGDVKRLHLNGEMDIENVWFKTPSTLMSNKQFPVIVKGHSKDSIILEDADVILTDSKIEGHSIRLNGFMNLKHCTVLDYSSIENPSAYSFDVLHVTLKDFSRLSVEKNKTGVGRFATKLADQMVLKDDNHLVV